VSWIASSVRLLSRKENRLAAGPEIRSQIVSDTASLVVLLQGNSAIEVEHRIGADLLIDGAYIFASIHIFGILTAVPALLIGCIALGKAIAELVIVGCARLQGCEFT
jgi:hypothetical protein